MSLRAQIPDQQAMFEDPVHGVNLRESEVDLKPGEARLMQNCIYRHGIRTRPGSQRLTPGSLGPFAVTGGHKYYFGGSSNPQGKRLIAYNNRISWITDAGGEFVIWSSQTPNLNTYFTTWSITDKVYISNGADPIVSYNGSIAGLVSGTNIPANATIIAPILDRLMAITPNGIERTNAVSDSVWSLNSSWATIRPSLTGPFTMIYPHTLTSVNGDLFPGIVAFQSNAYYLIGGTQFGTDVTAGTATNNDAYIKLIDPRVGTSSPYSVCSVPGVGLFWLTSDLYVYHVPYGRAHGYYVGDKIYSLGATPGTESINQAAIGQVWMQYFDRFLRLGFPVGSNTYPSIEYWLDMRQFMRDPTSPVWFGPMTGRSLSRVWTEVQNGERSLFAGEGSQGNGAYVYRLDAPNTFTDAVANGDGNIQFAYQTNYKDFGVPSQRKYVRHIEYDINNYTGTATTDIVDTQGTIASLLPIVPLPR